MILKGDSPKAVLIHVGIIFVVSALLLMGFFLIYLPSTTNHGETITVPSLEGMSMEELENVLTARNLRYEVSDSSYSAEHPPLTILRQYPRAGQKVKENRKIYLWLNQRIPEKVKMPKLIDISVKSAQMELHSRGLVLGNIEYVPDRDQNLVLKQLYKGQEIAEGASIFKGSKIDLVAGDGLGNREMTVPNVVGMDLESAKFLIIGSGLKLGSVLNKQSEEQEPGMVVQQVPQAGSNIRVGDQIDIWVAEGAVESESTD